MTTDKKVFTLASLIRPEKVLGCIFKQIIFVHSVKIFSYWHELIPDHRSWGDMYMPAHRSISFRLLYFYLCILHIILSLLQSVFVPLFLHGADNFILTRCVHFTKGGDYRLNSETERRQIFLCVVSAGSHESYIISRLTVNLKFSITPIPLITKSCTVSTAFDLPPGNLALSVVAEASFVYIVWLIACKEHNELLMSRASDPAVTVCTVNVIRDSASCPWWANSAVVFTCAFSIFPDVGQHGTVCGQVRSCLWMISPRIWLITGTFTHRLGPNSSLWTVH